MSAKRSFDVRRSPKKKSAPKVTRRSSPSRRKPLKTRRREEFQRTSTLYILGVLALCGLVLFLLWRPEVRIATVEASGAADPASLEAIAGGELEGAYMGVFPRDSFFLYPERAIRQAILDAHPDVSAVSISRTGFSSIGIEAIARTYAFHWCGEPGAAVSPCYEADAEGLVFARLTEEAATTTPALQVYASLDTASSTDTYPLRARVVGAERIPDILRFVRAIKSLGVPVDSIAIRGDEADLFAPHGTRITYVIGNEEEAAQGAAASFPRLNLMDGSLEYVDLRFNGRAYLKRSGE